MVACNLDLRQPTGFYGGPRRAGAYFPARGDTRSQGEGVLRARFDSTLLSPQFLRRANQLILDRRELILCGWVKGVGGRGTPGWTHYCRLHDEEDVTDNAGRDE